MMARHKLPSGKRERRSQSYASSNFLILQTGVEMKQIKTTSLIVRTVAIEWTGIENGAYKLHDTFTPNLLVNDIL